MSLGSYTGSGGKRGDFVGEHRYGSSKQRQKPAGVKQKAKSTVKKIPDQSANHGFWQLVFA